MTTQAASASSKDIIISTNDEVANCSFISDIKSSTGMLKDHNWKHHIYRTASLKAKRAGATHLVVDQIRPTGVFHGSIMAKAYSCLAMNASNSSM